MIRQFIAAAILASFSFWGATLSVAAQTTPRATSGDFDLTYYWYDFGTGLTSQTWETSKYLYVEPTGYGDEYLISGFMKETLNPDPENSTFKVEPLHAFYNTEQQSFTIPGNQFLFHYSDDTQSVDISVIGVKYNENHKLTPDQNLDIEFSWDEYGFSLSPNSECVALLFGAYFEETNSYGGFGLALSPVLEPWNGTMIYLVAPDSETEAIPFTCNIWAESDSNTLTIYNYADCGYDRGNNFDIDSRLHTVKGYDIKLQELIDILGDTTQLIAADISDNYLPATQNDRTLLSGMYSISGEATMIFQQSWAAFYMNEPVGIYSNCYTLIDFDITNPSSAIKGYQREIASDNNYEWFDLAGRRIQTPGKGINICTTGNRSFKTMN